MPAHKEYEFGWNRGHPNHYISRYEQSKDHRFRTRVNNIQFESMITLNNSIPNNLLFNTHFINTNGTNNLSLDSEIILLQINNNLT